MALASILLAVAAFGCAAVGFVTTVIPVVGAVFSFSGPALALLGVVLGGIAMSRLKREGKTQDVARAGVILSVVAFVPSLLVAVFCGVCNAMFSSGQMHVQRDFHVTTTGPSLLPMAGTGAAGADALPPDPASPTGGAAPGAAPTPPGTPGTPVAPSMPPPPLPAGPRRDAPKPAPGH